MHTRTLSLQIDGTVHSFEEARQVVQYLGSDPKVAIGIERLDPPRVLAVRRIVTARELTLLLIDELIGKPIAVIGETISWHLDGLSVRFTNGRDELIL